jgi:hypothetical protein
VVADAIRRHMQGSRTNPIPETDRELIERHLLRVTLGTKENASPATGRCRQ